MHVFEREGGVSEREREKSDRNRQKKQRMNSGSTKEIQDRLSEDKLTVETIGDRAAKATML